MTGEPVEGVFRDPAGAVEAVADLDLGGVARGGADEPFAPGLCFVGEAGVEEGSERGGGVAERAVAVVPVAAAAELLGQ